MMSDEQRFSTGARVRTMRAVGDVPAGTRGTVAYSFLLAPLYQVCFDGDTIPQLVAHYKLVPDPPERFGQSDAALSMCRTRHSKTGEKIRQRQIM